MSWDKRCEYCKYFDPKKRKITKGLFFGYSIECSDNGYCLNRDNIKKYGDKSYGKRGFCSRFELCSECKEIDTLKKQEKEEEKRSRLLEKSRIEIEKNNDVFSKDKESRIEEDKKIYPKYFEDNDVATNKELSEATELSDDEKAMALCNEVNAITKEIHSDMAIYKKNQAIRQNKLKKLKLIKIITIIGIILVTTIIGVSIYFSTKKPEDVGLTNNELYALVEEEFAKEENSHYEVSSEVSNPYYYYDLKFYNAINPYIICNGELVVGGELFGEDENIHENYEFNYTVYLNDTNLNNIKPDCEYTLYDVDGSVLNKFAIYMVLGNHENGGVVLLDYTLDNINDKPINYDYIYNYDHYEIRISDFLNRSIGSINSVLSRVDDSLALY